eukprot:CAMPEP_0178845770 /NCGR_PEP_ID=MMETSP0746-20121128/17634_1 /TAXON_ID=913974 /ORGANISM="Nitzschia punctata, Strain CCMP561" /LENGTH=132 /DNA_ID=CAMNT_0020510027 /DNA_START=163 /DNA_END=558 /DNA_ORIENTATION=-
MTEYQHRLQRHHSSSRSTQNTTPFLLRDARSCHIHSRSLEYFSLHMSQGSLRKFLSGRRLKFLNRGLKLLGAGDRRGAPLPPPKTNPEGPTEDAAAAIIPVPGSIPVELPPLGPPMDSVFAMDAATSCNDLT